MAPQAPPVADRHQRDPEPLCRLVHGPFGLERHRRRALVQDGVPRRVVEEARHGDALLEAGGEGGRPFVFGVPAARARDEVRNVDGFEPLEQVGVGGALGAHLAQGVRVDDLLAEGPAGEVGALRDVEDGGVGRFADGAAAVDGPEPAEDAEEGGLAAAVGADDEEVRAGVDGEGEGGHERVAVWGDNGHGVEFDEGAFDHGAAAFENGCV